MPRIVSCHLRRCSQNHKSDRTEEAPPRPPCKGSRGLSLARVYAKHIACYSRNWQIYGHHGHTLSVTITRANCVRTAGEAGQVAWRIPAASAAGIVRSGPGAGRDVRGVGDRNGSFVGGRRHRREQGLLLKYPVPWSLRKGERRPCFQRLDKRLRQLDRRAAFPHSKKPCNGSTKEIQIYLLLDTALLHDSTAARVGALFQLLVQDTTAQDFGLPSSAIRLRR